MIWLQRKLGWLFCLIGGLAITAAVWAAIGLLPPEMFWGSPPPALTVFILGGGGFYLAKLGTIMCRD